MIFAVDGSGGSSSSAGYGVVAYDPDTKQKIRYNGCVKGFIITDAIITDECQINLIYGNKIVPPTNNRGELCAVLAALLIIKNYYPNGRHTIVADSQYCIKTITIWYHNWVRENILHTKKNIDIISKIMNIQSPNVTYVHQKAHMSKSSISKLTGIELLYAQLNAEADILADQGKC